jgi:4a-hydroxytetrahydrobiopterin dehydratase
MTDDLTPISAADFHRAEDLQDWRVLGDGAYLHVRTETFADSARLLTAVAGIPGVDAHPPAVDVRTGGVTFRLVTATDDRFGMTRADAVIARRIAGVARDLGFQADPSALQYLLIIPGAPAGADVMPFWRAVLGYEPRPDSPDEDLVDPNDRGAAFWLESMDEPRPDGGGAIHVAVWVPEELAEARVAAALAAGGRLVRDDFAPSWWTLADAAGNEADIATVASRD